MTDFVGFLPMPSGGSHEEYLTADYNAEMIEHIARYPRIRDLALFVGSPDDIVPETLVQAFPRSGTGPKSISSSPGTSPGSSHPPMTRWRRGGRSSVTQRMRRSVWSLSAGRAWGVTCWRR